MRTALRLAALLLSAVPAAAMAQSRTSSPELPHQICVANSAGYAAVLTWDARMPNEPLRQILRETRQGVAGNPSCVYFREGHIVRITAEVVRPAGNSLICVRVFEPARDAYFNLRGTIWNATCDGG